MLRCDITDYLALYQPAENRFTVCVAKIFHHLKITLLAHIVGLKSLQNIDVHDVDHFSDMSTVLESFQPNLDLSTHLTPIHPDAF